MTALTYPYPVPVERSARMPDPQNAGLLLLAIAALAVIGLWLMGSKKARASESPPKKAEPAVLQLTPHDAISLHQCYEGLLITGGIGSGKTSGPGNHLLRGLLRSGAGFVIIAAKTDDYEMIRRVCEQEGRSADLRRFGPGSEARFDFLNFELSSKGGSVQSAAALMAKLIEVGNRNETHGSEQFWKLSAERHMHNAIAGVWLAKGRCSIADVYAFVTTAPDAEVEMLCEDGVKRMVPNWRDGMCSECIRALKTKDGFDTELVLDYWAVEWPKLSDRTKSVVYTMVVNVLAKFMQGDLAKLVSEDTNISPMDAIHGKVIVIDTPYLLYREPGQQVSIVWKVLTQRCVLRRDVKEQPLPVVLWQDEFQLTALPDLDSSTQAVSRSAKLVTVAITQNCPLLIASLGGGPKAEKEAHALIANFQTKLLCANTDKETNEYMSHLLGHRFHQQYGGSINQQPYDPVKEFMGQHQSNAHVSFNEHWFPDVPPEEFTRLKKGGEEYGFEVACYVTQGGRRFSNGKTWVKASFKQKF